MAPRPLATLAAWSTAEAPRRTYRIGFHSIGYPFVWITEYRCKASTGDVAERVGELVRQTCEMLGVEIMGRAVNSDRVHILVSAPQGSPSEIVHRTKGRSAKRLFSEFRRFKERF